MITKMKKLSFLIHSKEYEGFLEHLRSLGIVHVIRKQQGTVQNEELQEDLNLLARCKNAIRELESSAKNEPMGSDPNGTTKGFAFDTPAKVLEAIQAFDTANPSAGVATWLNGAYLKDALGTTRKTEGCWPGAYEGK